MKVKAKYKEYRDSFYTLSGKASDAARQLSFAGIAVVWLFKQQDAASITVPAALAVPVFCFVVALALDAIQYSLATLIWDGFVQKHAGKGDDVEIETSSSMNSPANICFVLKLVAVFSGYALLILHFLNVVRFT